MRVVARLCLIAFSAALGVAVALRLGTEAMAVVVGVVMGILASLPVALLVLHLSRRQAQEHAEPPASPPAVQPPPQQQPHILVLQAPTPPAFQGAAPWMAAHPSASAQRREFHIIGDEE